MNDLSMVVEIPQAVSQLLDHLHRDVWTWSHNPTVTNPIQIGLEIKTRNPLQSESDVIAINLVIKDEWQRPTAR